MHHKQFCHQHLTYLFFQAVITVGGFGQLNEEWGRINFWKYVTCIDNVYKIFTKSWVELEVGNLCSGTCLERLPLPPQKSDLKRQMVSHDRFHF